VLAKFDHGNLNMLPRLAGSNPTAELVARLVFDELRDRLGPQAPLAVVRVEEAPGCVASYARIDS
jgi:6-pyruvoyl-tetrahydropterin synthase